MNKIAWRIAAIALAVAWIGGCVSAPQPEAPASQRYQGVLLYWFEGQSFRADGQTETWAFTLSDDAMRALSPAYPDGYEPGPGHTAIAVEVEGVLQPVDPEAHRYGCVGGCYNYYLAISRVYQAHLLRQACQPISAQVFFASNDSSLDSAAHQAIEDALEQVRRRACNVSRVSVIGHTDTVGSAASNVLLSEARARAVSDTLIALGADRALVLAQGAGEANLPRATADNVDEPINRMVELVFEAPTAETR